MSITYVILECTDEGHEGWRQAVEKWVTLRPDWQHKLDYEEESGDFERYYFNIQLKNKQDILDVAKLITDLSTAYPDIMIEWITKIKEASISFGTRYTSFVHGQVYHTQIDSRITQDIKKIKDILKNY